MRGEHYFAVPVETFRRAGYRIEAAIMAVPEAQSRLVRQRSGRERRLAVAAGNPAGD
jgi:hypothetical protein